jgi:hypothetical protein
MSLCISASISISHTNSHTQHIYSQTSYGSPANNQGLCTMQSILKQILKRNDTTERSPVPKVTILFPYCASPLEINPSCSAPWLSYFYLQFKCFIRLRSLNQFPILLVPFVSNHNLFVNNDKILSLHPYNSKKRM